MKEIKIELLDHSHASWICDALVRIGTNMATHFDQFLVEFGVTQAQFRLLRAVQLSRTASLTPSALAEHLKTKRPTVSVMTNRLVERGLLAQIPGANRRTFSLTLTESGQELMYRLHSVALVLADDTLKEIKEEELPNLRATLMTVERSLSASAKSKKSS